MAPACFALALVTSLSPPLRPCCLNPLFRKECFLSGALQLSPVSMRAWRARLHREGSATPAKRRRTHQWSSMEASGSVTYDDDSTQIARTAISKTAVAELLKEGYTVIDDAISGDTVDQFLVGAEGMERNGKLQTIPEQVAMGREDKIMVLDVWNPAWGPVPEHLEGVASVCAMMKSLSDAIEQQSVETLPWGRLSAPPFFQLAVYDGVGAKYVRHIDNDPEDPAAREGPPGLRICDRAVTALLYFNKAWGEDDGGYLRLYRPEPGKEEEVLAEIAPLAGRLVLFDSKKFFHEVLPSYRRRWALSAWLNGGEEGAAGDGESS